MKKIILMQILPGWHVCIIAQNKIHRIAEQRATQLFKKMTKELLLTEDQNKKI